MASFHNVTNEKSSDFEDADYDPDLEARLYAEIYYTNENYQQDYDTTDNSTENLGTNLTSTNSDAATNSKENFVNDTNRSKVSEKSSNQTSTYPSRSWVFRGGSNNARNDSGQQIVGPKHGKQQRLLAHKDLWLTRGQPEAQRNFGAAVQNLDDLPLETRLSEAETFATAVRRSKEISNLSTPLRNRSVENSNIATVVNRPNEAGNVSTQFAGGSINCENTSTVSNRRNVADEFSIQLRSGTTVSRSNEAGNFPTQLASGSINCENTSTTLNRPNVADDFSLQLRSGTTVNRSNEAGNLPTQFAGRSINCQNTSIGLNRPNVADDFSLQLRSGTALNRSNEAGNFPTQFAGGSINCGNISIGLNRPNIVDDFSIQLRSGTTVNRSNETQNINQQFGGGAIYSDNLASFSNCNVARNNSLPLNSGVIEVENIRPARNRFNEARNFSTPFRSGAIDQNIRTSAGNRFNKPRNASAPCRSGMIDYCNIAPVLNHSEISSPQFGRKKANQNSRTIVTRSKTTGNRKSNVDRAERFVADSLEADFEAEELFSSYLAHQVRNFRQGSETELINLFQNAEITDNIVARDYLSLLKSQRKKELILRRQAERRRYQEELKQYLNNANVIMDGKYKVMRSKKNKLKMREIEPEPVDISSDSDDSILEVPVPPKTPPPVIQLQDSDDDFDDDNEKSSKSPSKKGRKTNADESSTNQSEGNDSSKDDESSAVPTCENNPKISRQTARKTKNTEHSVASSNIQQECEDDSGKSSKNRQKKGNKSVEENREESAASRISEPDFTAESSAEPIAESSLTIPQKISRETPKKMKNAENFAATPNIQESEDDSGKSSKNRLKRVKKSAEENREDSAVSRISEPDFPAESSAEPIAESSLTMPQKISRETPKKMKNAENSVATPNIQESEDDFGKSSKNRPKRGKKWAEENREDSAVSRISEVDSLVESSAEPIAESSSTIPQKISRETPKKMKNAENSVATPNIQESEDDSGKSSKNRPKKGKKSAEENREDSAVSRILETDSLVESSAEPIAESSSTISQKISRETPKKTKNTENSVATPNIQECENDSGKSSKNRPKKGKKSAEEPREDSAVSRILETDSAVESSAEPVAEISSTIPQKISRDTPKKTKNVESSVSTSNEQECEDDSGKSSKSKTKKGKKSAEEPREDITTSQILESSSNDNESFAANREAKLQKILKDAAKKTRDTEISAAVPNSEDGNLILNCTEIQKGASSLEEIRKMREAANLIHAQSDDSMTESEANNWVNIAAGQANSSRKDNEICSTASSTDGVNPALWNQSTQENRVATAEASKEIEVQSVDDFLPIETTSKSTGGDFNAPMTNPETANSRKRQKASSPFKDFDVPAIPEKRLKNRQKTSREQTMTEYFFKPMSKELQAFYNNPWGGENLDICDVQSRMPKNPNCWAILDADLQGPTSKRRRLCPRCKTDSHYGKRCPEKAKAPSCYMCGEKGHTESRCPHTMCLTCGRKYATYRPTCGHCSHLHCAMCNGSGHTHVDCPDLWRRYHNTTTSTPPVIPKYAPNIMKPAQHLSCCNCAKRGHDVTMCRQLRWSQHFPTPMYISSYTAGPMYEPSNIPSTQQPLNNDLTDEASRHERYFDTDSNNLQMPELSQNEFLEETSIDSSIETIDILDDSPPPEPEISLSQAQILFQAGENDPKKTFRWYKSQRRIDTVENIDLTGILSGNVKPNFLINWQPYLPFHVEIIHDTVEGTFMGIKCATTRIFTAFEKVIFQWLSRTDAEKAYLVYDKKPYEISNDLIEDIKKKLILSRSVLPVVSLLRKISIADKTVKQTAANYKQTQSKKNRRRITSMTSQFGISANRRSQLITSLYRGNYVEKGDILLQRFRCLARERLRRCNSGKHLATREYFEFVWTYNEIFTFHKTEELTKAFDKAIASFLAENSMDSETQNEILKFPKAEVIEIQSTTGKDNFLAAKISEITNNSAVDTLAESLPLLANPAANCAANIDPQLAPEFSKINEDVSNYSEQVSTANTEITTNEGTQNPGGSSSGILMQSLGKKGRRTYRRLAKAAIKAANTSNVPRLQKIAKALKTKMANGTILTDEIDFLQREITIDLRRRRGIDGRNLALKKFGGARKRKRIGKRQEQRQGQNNQQSQQKGTSDDNPAYVNVHGNL